MAHPYRGITAALATKHGKGELIAPALNTLGIALRNIEIDTDQLGTFAPEIPRALPQVETVIKKARLGMQASGLQFGIASEGAIGPDPVIPLLNSTIEMLVWIDDRAGISITQSHRSLEIVAIKEEVGRESDLEGILKRADFPRHGLIIYARGGTIHKGILSEIELESALAESLAESKTGRVWMESDLRSQFSPSRQRVIAECAKLLAKRLAQLCAACGAPGFGEIAAIYGLPCEQCGKQVDNAIGGKVLGCAKCEYREEEFGTAKFASAATCLICNP